MSGYLAHLPPVLWPGERPALGDFLTGFEQVLSGIEGVEPRGVAQRIDTLADLFSPEWTDQLEWLAGWVGLELKSGWDERQRRAAIGEIMRIYARRGAKEGLARHLDLYGGDATRQRIVIDNGAKVLFAGADLAVHTLVSQGAYENAYSGLVSPQCLALAPDGNLLVGDAGGPADAPPRPGVWRITRTGDYADLTTPAPGTPTPVGPPNWPRAAPHFLATQGTAAAWELFVLDVELRLFRVSSANLGSAQQIAVTPALSLDAAAMVARDGHLYLADRDGVIVEVTVSGATATARTHDVAALAQPRSMIAARDGSLLVGDARTRDTAGAADLVRVDRTAWTGTSLLGGLAGNPLVAPYALAEDADGSVLVADVGLRPDRQGTEPFLRTMIEPAALFRVQLGRSPAVSAAAGRGELVFPRGLVLHEGVAYLCDGGEPNDTAVVGGVRNFRMAAHEFGVIVHFDKDNTSAEYQRSVVGGVGEIVDRERPASTLPTYLDAIGAG